MRWISLFPTVKTAHLYLVPIKKYLPAFFFEIGRNAVNTKNYSFFLSVFFSKVYDDNSRMITRKRKKR